ncbi:MAG: hypothetical protein ABIH50_02130 [bacterium]
MFTRTRLAFVLLFVLVITPAAFGTTILKAVLEDLFVWDGTISSDVNYIDQNKSAKANCSFEQNNIVKSEAINLNDASSSVNVCLPIENGGFIGKSALEISSLKGTSTISLNKDGKNFNFSGKNNSLNLSYNTQLSNYFAVGMGVTQDQNAVLERGKNLGYHYFMDVRPDKHLAIKYSNYNDDLYGHGEKFEIENNRSINDKVVFLGKIGRKCDIRGFNIYDQNNNSAYYGSDSRNYFGVVGAAFKYQGYDVIFNLGRCEVSLQGSGSTIFENSPELLASVGNVNKQVDLDSKMSVNGCHLGLKRMIFDRLTLDSGLDYINMSLDGKTNIWNSFFFGMANMLDQSLAFPYRRIDYAQFKMGLTFKINETMELNYSFKQIVPVLAEKDEQGGGVGGPTGLTTGSTISGGNTQTFSLAYLF